MPKDPFVIQAKNLSKLYRIGPRERYKALRDSLGEAISIPLRLRRANPSSQGSRSNLIWALKDVSLEVKRGEVLGIIGPNGAGKSTLLRILSRITEPTQGWAQIRGRVGSLLEVGTGFHPELTGRENIFLSGAILGMKKAEIDRKFDRILSFAEMERFVDTPVKHYSTGMQVRLAFAVGAHLDPEILLVDEVLAVGDARFQKQCLGKMGDVARGGRTVLFVSHNLQAIGVLCQRAILLKKGRIEAEGPAREIVSRYLSAGNQQAAQAVWPFELAPGTPPHGDVVKLHAVRVVNSGRKVSYDWRIGEPIGLEVEFWCLRPVSLLVGLQIFNEQGMLLFSTSDLENWGKSEFETGFYRSTCTIPGRLLMPGAYYVTLGLSRGPNGRIDVYRREVVSFQVIDDGTGRDGFAGEWNGLIRPILPWFLARLDDIQIPKGQR